MEVNLDDITVCCVSHYAPDAFMLMWESFLKNHRHLPGRPRLYVYDNGSDEDQKAYFRATADLVVEGENRHPHGENLTTLCEKVQTRYVLTVDNDIQFIHPVVEMLLEAMEPEDVYGACLARQEPFGTAQINGITMQSQYSPNIAMGLMKMERVKHVLQYVSFGYYVNASRKEFFETGAMFWRVAEACGWRIAELEDLWHRVKHYGQISMLFPPDRPVPSRAILEVRYKALQEQLALLRAGA